MLGYTLFISLCILKTLLLHRVPITTVTRFLISRIICHIFPHLYQNIFSFKSPALFSKNVVFFHGIQKCIFCGFSLFQLIFPYKFISIPMAFLWGCMCPCLSHPCREHFTCLLLHIYFFCMQPSLIFIILYT